MTILHLIIIVALAGCTVTVSPVSQKKRTVTRYVVKHPKKKSTATTKPKQVEQGPRTGEKTVDAEWMKEYVELQAKYGKIPADERIKVNDGRFIINDDVSARYQELKKKSIEQKEQQ